MRRSKHDGTVVGGRFHRQPKHGLPYTHAQPVLKRRVNNVEGYYISTHLNKFQCSAIVPRHLNYSAHIL